MKNEDLLLVGPTATDRIATALERIAAALEALAAKPHHEDHPWCGDEPMGKPTARFVPCGKAAPDQHTPF